VLTRYSFVWLFSHVVSLAILLPADEDLVIVNMIEQSKKRKKVKS